MSFVEGGFVKGEFTRIEQNKGKRFPEEQLVDYRIAGGESGHF